MWRMLPGMAARLVLNCVVQGRGSAACTSLGSNRWMVSVKSCLEFVHVDVFWGSISVNLSSAVNNWFVVPSIKSSSSLSSSLSGVIVSVITSTRHLPSS